MNKRSGRRVVALLLSGIFLIALTYGIFHDGFSKVRVLMLRDCAIVGGSTSGWTRVGTSYVSFLIPPSFKRTKGGGWVDGDRSIQEAWFLRRGTARPKMSNACKLDGKTAFFHREVKEGQVWVSLGFLGETEHSNPDGYHIIQAHGRAADEALLSAILSTARVSD